MAYRLTDLRQLQRLPFDAVIDVRSPAEFAEDHLPGAVNLPVLSDEERARVGTIYVQQDRFLARRIGAALVARNAARHLEGPLADKGGGWRPLVYCWRGGMRSGSFATILSHVGWRVEVLEGGWRSWRRLVVDALYAQPFPCEVVLIDGGTGTAKTRLLHHLEQAGAQVLDLEGMAEHRGSIFGRTDRPQPSQKAFESRLATAVAALDPARPVLVEAESNRIGRINLPPGLWTAMKTARVIRIAAPLEARARHLVTAYADLCANPERLDAMLAALVRFHGRERVEAWRKLAAAGAWEELAARLITAHYDPRYAHQPRGQRKALAELELPDLSDRALSEAADRIRRLIGD